MMTDAQTVDSCPSCESSQIYTIESSQLRYRCSECGAEFDQPVEREPVHGKKIPVEEVHAALRDAAAALGEPLSSPDYEEWRRSDAGWGPHRDVIGRRWGWAQACADVGLVPANESHDFCAVLSAVERIREQLGLWPTSEEYTDQYQHPEPAIQQIFRQYIRWGPLNSWMDLICLCASEEPVIMGCPTCQSSQIYERERKDPKWRCEECNETFAEPVERRRKALRGEFTAPSQVDRLRAAIKALQLADSRIDGRVTTETYSKLGRSPSKTTIRKLFGSWRTATTLADVETHHATRSEMRSAILDVYSRLDSGQTLSYDRYETHRDDFHPSAATINNQAEGFAAFRDAVLDSLYSEGHS